MMPVMPHGPDQIAPGELELVREFVNTRDVELANDRLGTGTEAREWMEEHGLALGGRRLAAGDLERLTAVREALRALLLANNSGERPPAEALEALNRESAQAAVCLRFDAGGSALVGRGESVDSAIAQLLSRVHDAMRDGTWGRLKVCPAGDCLWAFYDNSRNRSGRWCRMEECGNRAKARAYRERRRPAADR
jgi:predicted RNA-binding Zn ribbon-like protein